eukprot:scaffold184641_cov17-Tisochrysis_lutea.AAC.1
MFCQGISIVRQFSASTVMHCNAGNKCTDAIVKHQAVQGGGALPGTISLELQEACSPLSWPIECC